MNKIRKGDLVQVIAGADRGVQGKVIGIQHHKKRVRVEKARMVKRHLKPGRRGAAQGGIVEDEGFIDASNVMLVNPGDGKPSRVRIEERDGARVRVFTKSGEVVPDPAR